MIQVVFYKITNEIQVFCFARKMTFFSNLNLASYTVTPAQGSDGKLFIFFRTIPQEVVFCGSAPMVSVTPIVVQISSLDEEEASFVLTPKGISNNVVDSPTNSPRKRRHPTKRAAPTATTKVARNSQVSRKRALDEYQNQLVARSVVPVSSSFTSLRIIAKNSTTGQLRQAWEVPQPTSRPDQIRTALRDQCKPQAPTRRMLQLYSLC
jgi:hypothetical protein